MQEFKGLEGTFATILIDPPWQFQNKTGKVAPEHKRLHRYRTMTFGDITLTPCCEVCPDAEPSVSVVSERPFERGAGHHGGVGLHV